MLHFAQHDKSDSVIPNAVRNPVHGCFASLSMTSVVSFRTLFFVIPSESEESSAMWMLHFAQHDKSDSVIPNAVRNPVWMLRFAQHDKSDSVIPNAVRNPVWMLRFAQHDKSGKRGCLTSLSWIGL